MTTKTCKGECGEEKELTEYYPRTARKERGRTYGPYGDGFASQCKACWNASSKARYQKNREARLVTARAWRIANFDKIKAYREESYRTNREYIREKARANRLKNVEAYRERDKRYYDNKLKSNETYMAHRNAYDRKRNAVETDNHTIPELHQYWRAKGIDPKRCTYCDAWHTKWMNNWKRSAGDHVVPLCRGGKDIIENIVPCCKSCNSSKNSRLLYEEWIPPKERGIRGHRSGSMNKWKLD